MIWSLERGRDHFYVIIVTEVLYGTFMLYLNKFIKIFTISKSPCLIKAVQQKAFWRKLS